jgi:16S rRNA (guanine527-N7)-methyltransferase
MNQDIILLSKSAHILGIELNERQLFQFDVYKNELLNWNAKTNLISDNSSSAIISHHFIDSLTALRFIPNPASRMIDIGCGAGFPGIPLKIALPDLNIYLLEANRKKVSFLKHIIRLLNLSAATVVHDRVENIMKTDSLKENFDILISRAVFKLNELLRLGDFFLVPEGLLIALKGPLVDAEIKQYLQAGNGGKISQLIQHDIDTIFFDSQRKIIIGKKQK